MNAVLKPSSKSRKASRRVPLKAKKVVPSETPLLRTISVTVEVTWRSFAADAFEQSGHDKIKAIEIMQAALIPGSLLFEKLVSPIISDAIENATRIAKRDHNGRAWNAIHDQPQTGNRLEDLALSLLDTVLPNNVKLRDASANDLHDASHRYRSQANTMAHKARWCDAIAQKIGAKRVGDVFKDDEILRKLQESTKV